MSGTSESEQYSGSLPKKIWTGSEVFFENILSIELLFLAKLGNKERFERWRETEFFPAARREWHEAIIKFAFTQGLGPVLRLRADLVSRRIALGPMKDSMLLLLRRLDEREVTLQNHAAVLYAAARQGDVEFFKKISLALRSRGRTKPKGASLSSYILCYWFSGLLWLMGDKPGWAALCAYTGKAIEKAAYRKGCQRLGLNGYRVRVKASPVLEYDPRLKIYKYGSKWTRMEPHLST